MRTKKLFGLVAALACAVGLVFAIAPAFAGESSNASDAAYLDKGNISITDNGTNLSCSYFDAEGVEVNKTINYSDSLTITQTNSNVETDNTISVSLNGSSEFRFILSGVNIKTKYGDTPIKVVASGGNNKVNLVAEKQNIIQAGVNYTSSTVPSEYHDNYGIFVEDGVEDTLLSISSIDSGLLKIIAGDINAKDANNPQNTRAIFSHGPILLDNANAVLVSGNTPYNAYANSNAIYSWHNVTIKNSKIKAYSGDGSSFGVIRAYDDGISIVDSDIQVYSWTNDESGFGIHESYRTTYPSMSVNGYCLCIANSGTISIDGSEVYLKTGKARFNCAGIDCRAGDLIINDSVVNIVTGDAEYTGSIGIISDKDYDVVISDGSDVTIQTGNAGNGTDTNPGWTVCIDTAKNIQVDNSNLTVKTGQARNMYGLGYYANVTFSGETKSYISGGSVAFACYTTTGEHIFDEGYSFFTDTSKKTSLSMQSVDEGITNYTLKEVYFEGTNIAKIGDKTYVSLASAVKAASGKTVVMIADTVEDVVIPVGVSCTLDLAGYTIVGNVNVKDGLVITDSSANNDGGITGTLTKSGPAGLSIKGGCYNANPESFTAADYYVYESPVEAFLYQVAKGEPKEKQVIVEETTEAKIAEDAKIPADKKAEVQEGLKNAEVIGVAESFTANQDKVAEFLAEAGVTAKMAEDTSKALTVDIKVEVEVTALETIEDEKTDTIYIVFDATPYATITDGDVVIKENVPVSNDYLTKGTFFVMLNVPSNINPLQIIHESKTAGSEVFNLGEKASLEEHTFVFNELTRIATVEVDHFSTFTITNKTLKVNVTLKPGEQGTGEELMQVVDVNTEYALPACGFEAKEGYEFAGWKIGDKVYQAGDKFQIGEDDVVATATWKEVAAPTPTPVPGTGDSAPLAGIALFALLAVAGLAIARKRLA